MRVHRRAWTKRCTARGQVRTPPPHSFVLSPARINGVVPHSLGALWVLGPPGVVKATCTEAIRFRSWNLTSRSQVGRKEAYCVHAVVQEAVSSAF